MFNFLFLSSLWWKFALRQDFLRPLCMVYTQGSIKRSKHGMRFEKVPVDLISNPVLKKFLYHAVVANLSVFRFLMEMISIQTMFFETDVCIYTQGNEKLSKTDILIMKTTG